VVTWVLPFFWFAVDVELVLVVLVVVEVEVGFVVLVEVDVDVDDEVVLAELDEVLDADLSNTKLRVVVCPPLIWNVSPAGCGLLALRA
jgi:hypothetical protein